MTQVETSALTMNEDRRFVLTIALLACLAQSSKCGIDFANQAQEDVGALRHVEVGPADTLDLHDLSRRHVGMTIVRNLKHALDVRLGHFVPLLRCSRGHAKVETSSGSSASPIRVIFTSHLRDELESYGPISLLIPVITALDRSALELLGDPGELSAMAA